MYHTDAHVYRKTAILLKNCFFFYIKETLTFSTTSLYCSFDIWNPSNQHRGKREIASHILNFVTSDLLVITWAPKSLYISCRRRSFSVMCFICCTSEMSAKPSSAGMIERFMRWSFTVLKCYSITIAARSDIPTLHLHRTFMAADVAIP